MEERIVKCNRCQCDISEDESFGYFGEVLCDDCYMDVMAKAQPCDPWAVKMATGSLTSRADAVAALKGNEKALYALLQAEGRVAMEAAPGRLGIGPDELRRALATLRHMELVRADRRDDGGADLVLFDE